MSNTSHGRAREVRFGSNPVMLRSSIRFPLNPLEADICVRGDEYANLHFGLRYPALKTDHLSAAITGTCAICAVQRPSARRASHHRAQPVGAGDLVQSFLQGSLG